MNKVRKRFVWYAMLSLFALLTVLLAIINGINFTMAGNDADMLTQSICERHGAFAETADKKKKYDGRETGDVPQAQPQGGENRRMGPMGPSSPEMNSSLRYFTYAVNSKGEAEKISFKLSAVDEAEAKAWALSLYEEKSSTGWTRGTYRYRIYKEGKRTFITVIDQGRELLPSYRILNISICGELVVLAICFFVLMSVGKRLFKPLEEADRNQKRFIANIESEFKIPLTVINADTELLETELGTSEYTKSINRQVRKMTELVKEIGTLAIFEEEDASITTVNLSSTLGYVIDANKPRFEKAGIKLETDIEDDITIGGEDEAIKRMFTELVKNSLRYAVKNASFTLSSEGERITLTQSNDCKLKNGSADQVFDRFTVLENAKEDAVGLGLSSVKDTVLRHNGRITARVTDGVFTLTITL